jgi:hypothetical protein
MTFKDPGSGIPVEKWSSTGQRAWKDLWAPVGNSTEAGGQELASCEQPLSTGLWVSSSAASSSHRRLSPLLLEWIRTVHREPFRPGKKADVLHSWKQTNQYLPGTLCNTQILKPLICTLMNPAPQTQADSDQNHIELRWKVAGPLLGVAGAVISSGSIIIWPLFEEEDSDTQRMGDAPLIRRKMESNSLGIQGFWAKRDKTLLRVHAVVSCGASPETNMKQYLLTWREDQGKA